MKIIDKNNVIDIEELEKMSHKMFGNLVKAVVDIEKEIMSIDADLHADEEEQLLQGGSQQTNLWGINLYPEKYPNDWIEFDSVINLRPSFGNRTRGVDDIKTQAKIKTTVNKLVLK